jgi:hypothetical protein
MRRIEDLKKGHGMKAPEQERLDYLRAKLASARVEREALSKEMTHVFVNPTRARQASRRYSAVLAEIVEITREMQSSIVILQSGLLHETIQQPSR